MFNKQIEEFDVPVIHGVEIAEIIKDHDAKMKQIRALKEAGYKVVDQTRWLDEDTGVEYDHYVLEHDGVLTE